MSNQVKGVIHDGQLPYIIRECHLERSSGILDLRQGRHQRRISLVDGEVRSARSNRLEQRVGQFLVRSNVINQFQLLNALSLTAEGKPIGQRLVDMGVLPEETLTNHLRDLVREIIFDCFRWSSGEYRILLGKPTIPSEIEIPVPTVDLLYQGLRNFGSEEMAKKVIGDLNRVLIPNEDIIQVSKRVALDPSDGFILARIDGRLTTNQLLESLPEDPAKSLLVLASLVACGLVSIQGQENSSIIQIFPKREIIQPKRRSVQPAKEKEKSEVSEPDKAKVDRSKFRPVKPVIKQVGLTQKDISKMRELIEDKHKYLQDSSHYDLLGIPIKATLREIRFNYDTLCHTFNEENLKRPELSDLREKIVAVLEQLEKAYYTLSDRNRRIRYNRIRGYSRFF